MSTVSIPSIEAFLAAVDAAEQRLVSGEAKARQAKALLLQAEKARDEAAARKADQVRGNVAAADVQMPRDVYEQFDRISRRALEGMALPCSMWDWYPDKALDEQERQAARK